MQGGVRGAGCWVWAAWRASESLPEKGLTRVCHWWLERDSRQGWVQHMLSWPKGSLRTNGRRMPSSGATLTSKLGSICRSRSRCLCLHFSFGFPSRFPSFCPSYCCFGIFLHSNHFKEAARLLQLPCNSFCWLPISTSEAQRKEAATSAAEWEPASREKRQQQDKPLKGYQDMTSSAPRQIGKGWERQIDREGRTSWGVMPTSIHRCSSTHLTPSPVLGLSAAAWAQFTNPNWDPNSRACPAMNTCVPQPTSAGRDKEQQLWKGALTSGSTKS